MLFLSPKHSEGFPYNSMKCIKISLNAFYVVLYYSIIRNILYVINFYKKPTRCKPMIQIEEKNKGQYRFVVKNTRGSSLFNSTSFPSREAAQQTLSQLSSAQRAYAQFERQTDHSGNFLFQLRPLQGERIGKSTTFSSEAGMENGIKYFRRNLERWQQALL